MCKFLICMIDAYKCISEWCPKFAGVDCEHVGTLMAWLGVGMVGFQTRGRIDGLILMLPSKGKGFFLYTHLCVHPFIYLLYFFISMFIYLYILIYICRPISKYTLYTSSTAQGGGGSFKNRKPIGEVGCCESGMAERSHCWIERCLISLTLSLSFSDYLPTYLSIFYVSIYLSI